MAKKSNKPHPITSVNFGNDMPLLLKIDRLRGRTSRSAFVVAKLKRALR